ncbi:DUF1566 domain-containing protein [bacterium]|nr:DUF1566 domain-containing protein [bacterium]
MKKIFVAFALLSAMVLMVSCGGGSSDSKTGSLYEKCYPNETCNKGLICDIENNVCVKDWCKSNNDCTDPEYPVCNTKTGNCESSDGRKPGDESDSDSDTQDSGDSDNGKPDNDTGNPEPTDTDSSSDADSVDDSGDSQPDCDTDYSGDTEPDNGDSAPDNGDTEPDNDYPQTPCDPNPCTSISNSTGVCTVNGTGYTCGCQSGYTWNGGSCQSNGGSSLPECSKTSGTPCYDSSSHLTWSKISSSTMTWSAAATFCQGSEMNGYGGFTDWRLPNIDELKTLITVSSGTPRTQNCAVSEATGHLASSDWTCSTCTEACTQSTSGTGCSSCNGSSDGRYSKLGDGEVWLWSSSLLSGNSHGVWYVVFDYGGVSHSLIDYDGSHVRCVR